jgi:hypothetical protein
MSNFREMARKPGQINGAVVAPLSDAAELDAKIYGSLGELSAGKIVAKPIDIRQIVPDFAQPRQQIPSAVRSRWNRQVDAESMADLFNVWTAAYADEIGVPFDQALNYIYAILDGNADGYDAPLVASESTQEHKLGVMQASLMKVAWLAANIQSEGHHDPIMIYRVENGYRIIDGERRWLAHCLLAGSRQDAQFGRIKAIIEDRPNVWAQADKNSQRQGLTAIGRARQLAILLMDLYMAQGQTFQPYEAFEHDLGFYAQVADGNKWSVPRGSAARLSAAMGNLSEDMLRKYRALLRLPAEVWTMADDLGWSENFIREIERATNNDLHLTRTAALYAREQGYSVTTVTVSAGETGQERSEGVIYDAAAEAAFRDIVGDEPPQWDGVAVDEDGVAYDAWTDTPLDQAQPPVVPTSRSAFDRASAVVTTPASPRISQPDWDKQAASQRDSLLGAAFGKFNGGWFNAKRIGAHPEVLQVLARQGLFSTRPSKFNMNDRSMDDYQITDAGRAELRQMVQAPASRTGELPVSSPRPLRDAALITRSVASMFDGLQALRMSDLQADQAARNEIASAVRRFIDEMERLYNRVIDGQ